MRFPLLWKTELAENLEETIESSLPSSVRSGVVVDEIPSDAAALIKEEADEIVLVSRRPVLSFDRRFRFERRVNILLGSCCKSWKLCSTLLSKLLEKTFFSPSDSTCNHKVINTGHAPFASPTGREVLYINLKEYLDRGGERSGRLLLPLGFFFIAVSKIFLRITIIIQLKGF